MIERAQRAPLAMTMGDPAGIGPELALRAWLARDAASLGLLRSRRPGRARWPGAPARPCCADRRGRARRSRRRLCARAAGRAARRPRRRETGRAEPDFAAATIESIERAVASVKSGAARAVVTNPIAKATLYAAGFKFPGHTEFLGALAERDWGGKAQPVMMIWSPALAVVPITIHVAVKDAPRLLTRELIVSTAHIVAADMTRRFGVARPRLAFAGLNPHAGEGGAMGREEIETIAPAIETLRAEGLDVVGPLPADTMFHAAARARYDVALTMYHDQGLIPAKTLAFDSGVNVTLGLPFVRTSPDHGTAFDIAGKGVASPTSLIAALKLAARLAP